MHGFLRALCNSLTFSWEVPGLYDGELHHCLVDQVAHADLQGPSYVSGVVILELLLLRQLSEIALQEVSGIHTQQLELVDDEL